MLIYVLIVVKASFNFHFPIKYISIIKYIIMQKCYFISTKCLQYKFFQFNLIRNVLLRTNQSESQIKWRLKTKKKKTNFFYTTEYSNA